MKIKLEINDLVRIKKKHSLNSFDFDGRVFRITKFQKSEPKPKSVITGYIDQLDPTGHTYESGLHYYELTKVYTPEDLILNHEKLSVKCNTLEDAHIMAKALCPLYKDNYNFKREFDKGNSIIIWRCGVNDEYVAWIDNKQSNIGYLEGREVIPFEDIILKVESESKETIFEEGDLVEVKNTAHIRSWPKGFNAIGYKFKIHFGAQQLRVNEFNSSYMLLCVDKDNTFSINYCKDDLKLISKAKKQEMKKETKRPTYKIGDAVFITDPDSAAGCNLKADTVYYVIQFVDSGNDDNLFVYCAEYPSGPVCNGGGIYIKGVRKATTSEIIKRSLFKGFEVPFNIDSMGWAKGDIAEFWNTSSSLESDTETMLYYVTGKPHTLPAEIVATWKPVLLPTNTLPTINGYEGKIDVDGYVTYGCAKFDKGFLMNLSKTLKFKNASGNREVASIKLTSGVEITVEQLNQIVICFDEK